MPVRDDRPYPKTFDALRSDDAAGHRPFPGAFSMIRKHGFVHALLLSGLLMAPGLYAHATEPQVLATVGDQSVNSSDLKSAIASSPYAVQFNTMNEDDQAALRGSMLQRLVASRLLLLEARKLDLEHSAEYQSEQETFRNGLLYRLYMDELRAGIVVPDDIKAEIKQKFAGNGDARKAAEATYRANRYDEVLVEDLKRLRQRYQVQVHDDAIRPDAPDNAVLLEGDDIRITYGDIKGETDSAKDNAEWIRDRLYKRAQFLLVVRAADERKPEDLPRRLADYRSERLPAMLLEHKEREWIPDDKVLEDYFRAHPDLGRVLERRHVGQLVLATRPEAEAMRKRILAGESLFDLAGQHSVDPYGRAHKGDMGWVKVGQGMPAVEQAIAHLPDGAVSEVIESPMGFHLVTIIERSPGAQRSFRQVHDKVRQAFLDEHLATYMDELSQRFPVQWQVLGKQQAIKN